MCKLKTDPKPKLASAFMIKCKWTCSAKRSHGIFAFGWRRIFQNINILILTCLSKIIISSLLCLISISQLLALFLLHRLWGFTSMTPKWWDFLPSVLCCYKFVLSKMYLSFFPCIFFNYKCCHSDCVWYAGLRMLGN